MSDLLTTLEADLRCAAECHDFIRLQQAAEAYCAEAAHQGAAQTALSTIEWALALLYDARQSYRSDLQRIGALQQYGTGPGSGSVSLEV